MLRYLAIATALVFGALAIVLALPHVASRSGAARYSSGTGTPGPAQRDERSYAVAPVSGDAPWALSALPECFRQVARSSGALAFVRGKIPREARRVAAGSELHAADCSVRFGADFADVSRGENALRVPAPARFYVTATRLLLEREDGARAELRTFALRGAGGPQISPSVP